MSDDLDILSVHFQFPGGRALPLREPATDRELGEEPEWIRDRRNAPVAYVRGSRPTVRAVFLTSFACPETIEIAAWGSWGGGAGPGDDGPLLRRREVRLAQDRADLTEPIELELSRPLPDRIGLHTLSLSWYAFWSEEGAEEPVRVLIGTTTHTVCTTWRAPLERSEEGLWASVLAPLMLWTCAWCAGKDSPREICDAILASLPASNLRYGIPGWSLRYMLLRGGGMCGGWNRLFQAMAGCQGVFVERRTFRLRWGGGGEGEARWSALVRRRGGINQPFLSEATSTYGTFAELRGPYPVPAGQAPVVERVEERRYCVWGSADGRGDGHCINLLAEDGEVLIYDPSFHQRSFAARMSLPPRDGSALPPEQTRAFKQVYLDETFELLLGTVELGGTRYVADERRGEHGLAVPARLVSDLELVWGR